MAQKFVLTAQLQLQAPSNTRQVVSQIRNQLKGVSVDLKVKHDPKTLKQANQQLKNQQQDFEMQTRGLVELQSRNQEIQLEMNRYLDIFKRHNLSKLAAAKPGLIEKRVNNGTKEVFDGIEADSRIIDGLDDGLQLQPDS